MAGVAACVAPLLRRQMLREMGIEPLVLRSRGSGGGAARFLILAPSDARHDPTQTRLVQRIVDAAALPEGLCTLVWVQPGASSSLPAHCGALALGVSSDQVAEDQVIALPSPQTLLRDPAGKRQVWQALREFGRRVMAEA